MPVSKTLNFTQPFLCCNTYRQAVNQHITRFPYQFQKTVIHLSVSSLPQSSLTLQLLYSTSKWGLRFQMAWYQKSTCSHSGGKAKRVDLVHGKTSLRRVHFQEEMIRTRRKQLETEPSLNTMWWKLNVGIKEARSFPFYLKFHAFNTDQWVKNGQSGSEWMNIK